MLLSIDPHKSIKMVVFKDIFIYVYNNEKNN